MGLITLEQAKRQVSNEFFDAHDAFLAEAIDDASKALLDYLKVPLDSYQDSLGKPLDVPGCVVSAVKLMVAEMYKNREAAAVDVLSPAVTALVHRLRDPALA
jgi:hypothetical protein